MAIDTIKATAILDGSVDTADLADNAVTTAKITDGNVTLAKLSATGTKDATTFLRGDNSFQVVDLNDVTGDFTVDTDVLVVDSTNDRVGINESTPSHPFHIQASAAGETTMKVESNQAGAMFVALDVDTDRDCLLQFQEAGTTRWDFLMNGSIGTNPLKIRDDGGTTQGEFDQSGNFKFNSGFGSAATAYGCRAWANFNAAGTPSINGNGNVSSISDISTGVMRVNFSNSMPNNAFSAVLTAGNLSDSATITAVTLGGGAIFNTAYAQFDIIRGSSRFDANIVTIAVFI